MNHNTTRKIAIAGTLGALTVFLGITHLGLIPWFSGAAITILQVPVIIGAIIEGPIVGMAIGAIFGISSLIQAAIAPTGPLDPLFVNPLVSVLPRICIGLITWLVYGGLKLLFSKSKKIPRFIPTAIASFVGSLSNTVLVLLVLVATGAIEWVLFVGILVSNGLLEAAASTIIATAVVVAWQKISTRSKSKLNSDSKK